MGRIRGLRTASVVVWIGGPVGEKFSVFLVLNLHEALKSSERKLFQF